MKNGFFKWLADGVDFARADLVDAMLPILRALRVNEPKGDIDADYDNWVEQARALPRWERPDEEFFQVLERYHTMYEAWLEEQITAS